MILEHGQVESNSSGEDEIMSNFRSLLRCFVIGWSLTACYDSSLEYHSLNQEASGQRVLEVPNFETTADAIEDAEILQISRTTQRIHNLLQEERYPTFMQTFGALDDIISDLFRTWNRLYLLMDTSPSEEVREAAAEAVVNLEQFYIREIQLNEDLYLFLREAAVTLGDLELTAEQQRYIAITLRSYEEEGMALPLAERERLKDYQNRLSELTTAISRHINNALGDVLLSRAHLEGLDEEQMSLLPLDPLTGMSTVRTSNTSVFRMIMRKARQSETRHKTLMARYQRARDENGPLMLEVLQLRLLIAQLLGKKNWADFRIQHRMAHDGQTALGFLERLDQKIDSKFKQEQLALQSIKRRDLALPPDYPVTLPLEDVDYYIDLWMQEQFAVDAEALRVYFPESQVIPGLFQILGDLFQLRFEEKTAPGTWVEDVRYFEVQDKRSDRLLGAFYLDLHPRPGKYTHFAEYTLVDGRQAEDGSYEAPIAAIVGNFPATQEGRPSLWSYEELTTLMHELGHVLHTVLTEARVGALAGTNVPQDFVEVPSQVLERWLEDPVLLKMFARHYLSGEPITDSLLQKILQAQTATRAHYYRRQLSFGIADLDLHRIESPEQLPSTVAELYARSNEDFSRYYPVDPDTGFLASFEHLFGGYDAGYYSYAWADVIAADIADTFRKSPEGFTNVMLGKRLRDNIFAVGNTRAPEQSIYEFLGRDFDQKAFLDEQFGADNAEGDSDHLKCWDHPRRSIK